MNSLLIVLPILPEYRQAYQDSPLLRESIDMAGGLKSLAEWCFHCGSDRERYVVGVSEDVFTKLEANDIDPRQERHHREQIQKFLLSDFFLLFLQNFFDQHSMTYEYLLGEPTDYLDHEPIFTRRADAIAIRLP